MSCYMNKTEENTSILKRQSTTIFTDRWGQQCAAPERGFCKCQCNTFKTLLLIFRWCLFCICRYYRFIVLKVRGKTSFKQWGFSFYQKDKLLIIHSDHLNFKGKIIPEFCLRDHISHHWSLMSTANIIKAFKKDTIRFATKTWFVHYSNGLPEPGQDFVSRRERWKFIHLFIAILQLSC